MKCHCGLKACSPTRGLCWIHHVHQIGKPKKNYYTPRLRLSIAPLVQHVEQLQLKGMCAREIAELAGVSRREIVRLKNGHLKDLTPLLADTWAGRFKRHPSELWPEWTAA